MVALSALRSPLRVLAPITELKEVLIHISFSVARRYQKMLYMARLARFAESHLGLRYLFNVPFWIFLRTCNNQLRTLNFWQATRP